MRTALWLTAVVPSSMWFSMASAHDLSTCSGYRDFCLEGERSRGVVTNLCPIAYDYCMRTGKWDTTHSSRRKNYGRFKDGIARR